jgi:hypothetical protein
MSYFYSKPFTAGDRFTDADALPPIVGGGRRSVTHSVDRAIDAALRNMPLPEGLMSRLSMLVYSLPDEAGDAGYSGR